MHPLGPDQRFFRCHPPGNITPTRARYLLRSPDVAKSRAIAGHTIPGIALFFVWLVLIILVIILLAWIVHLAGGGVMNIRLGHFILNVGFN
jgi:hypothetical protein